MRTALIREQTLCAPAVGMWRPAVVYGVPVAAGQVLGWLDRVGQPLEVRAPEGVVGAAVQVRARGFTVFGDVLVELGALASGALQVAASAVGGGPEGCVAVRADTDGTAWLSARPGEAPLSAVGQRVAPHATLLLVEVMKTFTPLRAPVAGEVVRIDAVSGQGVAAGAALVWLRPEPT